MDAIEKIISLEPSRSRVPGLLPYLGEQSGDTDNGNYGKFTFGVDFSKISSQDSYAELRSQGIKSYRDFIEQYNWIKQFIKNCKYYSVSQSGSGYTWVEFEEKDGESVHNGDKMNEIAGISLFEYGINLNDVIFLPTKTLSGMSIEDKAIIGVAPSTEDYATFISFGGILYYNFVNREKGKLYIPDTISGSLVPNFVYLCDISGLINQMLAIKAKDDCCSQTRYKELGGDGLISFLSNYGDTYIESEKEYFKKISFEETPCVVVPVLTTSQYNNLGEYSLTFTEWVPGQLYYIGDVVYSDEETFKCIKDFDLSDEESIAALYDITDTTYWEHLGEDNVKDYVAITYSGESRLEEFKEKKRSQSDDGEDLEGIITIISSGNSTFYYDHHLHIPYYEGKLFNEFKLYGLNGDEDKYADTIYSIIRNNEKKTLTFKYVLGGKIENGTYNPNSKTGIQYEETYNYTTSTGACIYEGNNISFTYDSIDYDSNKTDIDFNNRGVILSKVTFWSNEDKGSNKYTGMDLTYSPLFREEENFGFAEPSTWDVDVTIERGNNSAFEKHFKLGEVNSFEDLENYGNNYFNIEDE